MPFESHDRELYEEILVSIHSKETALPDFQRDFVWQPGQTRSLIISLAKKFPAGSILRLESGEPFFEPRNFQGAPVLNGHNPKYLVLDGQQRLTSLYQALYGTGDHLYYVNLLALLNNQDLDDAVVFYRREPAEKKYGTLENQAKLGMLPLQVIFGGVGFHQWLYTQIQPIILKAEMEGKPVAFGSEQISEINTIYTKYVEPIAKYKFPVTTIQDPVSLEAVCTIFETLNSTGVRLSVFDLLSARFFAKKENLRQRWSDALRDTRFLDAFGVDPYYVLQAICAEAHKSIKRSDVLKLSPDTVDRWWDNAIWGMDEALDMLYSECGVLRPSLLSYNTILVPLAAAFMVHRDATGPNKGTLRNKLKRWYWCSVFGQAYESNPTSQTITDVNELKQWIAGGAAPESVRTFSFDQNRLYTTTTRQRAIYRGVLCLILRQGPMDFHSTVPLTAGVMQENQVDDHHIFPDAYLKAMTKLAQQEIDAIVNRTLIDRETNQSIGKNPPSAYLDKVAAVWDNPGLLDKVLASHLLPVGSASSLRRDDFEAFRSERATQLYQHIIEVTS